MLNSQPWKIAENKSLTRDRRLFKKNNLLPASAVSVSAAAGGPASVHRDPQVSTVVGSPVQGIHRILHATHNSMNPLKLNS
jgi:hypothetical protein